MRRFFVLLTGLLLAVLALGVAVIALSTPAFTRSLSQRYSLAEEADLPPERMSSLAEEVRLFVVEGEGALPARVDGRPGFDADAVSHLADVHGVLAGARVATGVDALVLAVLLGTAIARKRRDWVAAAFRTGGAATAVLVALAGVVAVADFDAFFSAFHRVFFAAGTWTFSYDSLLIRLFPEPFWSTAGAAWAALVLSMGACYWALGVWLARGASSAKA